MPEYPKSAGSPIQDIQPNQVRPTEITHVWTLQNWLYVGVVIDPLSRQAVAGRLITTGPKRWPYCGLTLQMAFWCCNPWPGLLHHSIFVWQAI